MVKLKDNNYILKMDQFRQVAEKLGLEVLTSTAGNFFKYRNRLFILNNDCVIITSTDGAGFKIIGIEELEEHTNEWKDQTYEEIINTILKVIETHDDRFYSPSFNREDTHEKVFTDVCNLLSQLTVDCNRKNLMDLTYTIMGHNNEDDHTILWDLGLSTEITELPYIYRQYFGKSTKSVEN